MVVVTLDKLHFEENGRLGTAKHSYQKLKSLGKKTQSGDIQEFRHDGL
jgi:hypothetical protein